ncbi:hypothetical protein PLICRDRAFT_36062 [Plicaturopsis crispa FD-325 SS-3]|nr:hypothetical protein PLICRDRAFT_36062 [Plicaturopsis crispa FD-325 SS-3]
MLVASALLAALPFTVASAGFRRAENGSTSSYAGSTSTAIFPPANATATANDPNFPVASQVGFAGPTPTGDQPEAIATAPVYAKSSNTFPLVEANTSDHVSGFDIMAHWGNLAPFVSIESKAFGLPKTSPQVPDGCELTQAHLLHRHGARYPTSGGYPANLGGVFQEAAKGNGFSATGPLSFLNTWTYKLGAEILTPYGRQQLFNLGVGFRMQYGHLLNGFKDLPVFRTTSEARMVASALNFAAGFFDVQTFTTDYHQLISIEEDGFNNTLAPWNTCYNANTNVSEIGSVAANKWIEIYLAPAVKRLSAHIKGIELNTTTVFAMQELCPYETVALGYSAFCDLFTEEEWKGFEYANDLEFWYGFGPGNPTSAAQGIGYVQELISRLTKTRITDFNTTLNSTIVGSNVTFPLDQPIFVDATHDTIISAIIVAMNFTSFIGNGPLPTDHIPKNQTYFVNQIAPFGSRLVGQVLSCPASDEPTHIRWILNDGVVPLTGIKGCKANDDGLCELPAFISGIQERISEVDYAFDCQANYTVPDPDNIVDGRYPPSLRNSTA